MNARFRGPCPEPETLTALADGELDHDRREQVHQHLVACPRCRADVEGERRAKRAVQSLAPLTPEPELVARLRAIAGDGDIAGDVPADLVAARAARESRRRRGARPATVLTTAASVAVFAVGGAAYLGAAGDPAPQPSSPSAVTVVPATDRFALEHAATAVDGGLDESPITRVSTSFVVPAGTESR